MMKLPPLAALRAFEAVARLGGVVRAADELGLTHGAVSHQLKALEGFLDRPLLRRSGRRLVLTEDGRNYAAAARRALVDLGSATELLRRRPRADELVVSVLPSFAARWLVPRLGALRREHPGIALHLRTGLEMVDFAAEPVDCAIRMGGGRWDGVQAERIMVDAYLPVAAPAYRGGRLPLTPAAIAAADLLRSSAEPWRPWFDFVGHPAPEPRGGLAFTDSALLLQAAADGVGVALGRASLLDADLASGRLRALWRPAMPSPQACWLVWPARSAGNPRFESFRAWLKGAAGAYSQGHELLAHGPTDVPAS